MSNTKEIPPSFLIVGTQKGGTTAAHQILSEHPQLAGSSVKEIGYFFLDNLFQRGPDWYHSHFTGKPGQLSFEATPEYLCCPAAAERIAAYNPKMKIIVLLRNPVERAYSAWNMHNRVAVYQQGRANPDGRSFEEAIGEELSAMRSGWVARLNKPLLPGCGTQMLDYVRRGLYLQQIERYLEFFPRDQLLVLESRELGENLEQALLKITGFLGIEPFAALPARQEVAVAAYDSHLSTATRSLLRTFYRPFNQALYAFLGKSWDWDESR